MTMRTRAARREPTTLVKFNFHGDDLAVATEEGEPYAVLARLCEPFELDVQAQWRKLQTLPWARVAKITARDFRGQNQAYNCLHLRSIAGWLFTLNAGKVAPHLRDKLVVYQTDCAEALADRFYGPRSAISAMSVAEERALLAEVRSLREELHAHQEIAERRHFAILKHISAETHVAAAACYRPVGEMVTGTLLRLEQLERGRAASEVPPAQEPGAAKRGRGRPRKVATHAAVIQNLVKEQARGASPSPRPPPPAPVDEPEAEEPSPPVDSAPEAASEPSQPPRTQQDVIDEMVAKLPPGVTGLARTELLSREFERIGAEPAKRGRPKRK